MVSLAIGLKNEQSVEGTPGTARVVLPCRGGPEVPYPFDPACLGPRLSD